MELWWTSIFWPLLASWTVEDRLTEQSKNILIKNNKTPMPLNHFFYAIYPPLISLFYLSPLFPINTRLPYDSPLNTSTGKHSNRNKKAPSSQKYIKMEWRTPSYLFDCQCSSSNKILDYFLQASLFRSQCSARLSGLTVV